jgi:hypothetical protein
MFRGAPALTGSATAASKGRQNSDRWQTYRNGSVIAHELVASIKSNVSVDWMHREAARARMRVLVKRLLRKYGYPPDLQDAAVQKVLQQAEALSADWAA